MPNPNPFGKPAAREDEEFSADLSQAAGPDIPKGEYEIQLVDIRQQESKAGNPMWVWEWLVPSGDYAGVEVPMFTVLTPEAQWKVQEVVTALGLAGAEDKDVTFSKSDAIGRCCVGTIQADPGYKPAVKSVRPHPKGPNARKAGVGPSGPGANAESDDDLPF